MFLKGQKVRYSSDDRVGEITGKYRERNDSWQVLFDGVDMLYIPAEKLHPVAVREDVYDLFQAERFLSISDFRRRMYRCRMSGELTNVMYSMDNAVAKFMAHQFIPVVKFLESYTDRLLIADEVGLGKTIEAMYIWEELMARKNAQRLLVVVPAVLRDKWKNDMRRFFGINAEIVSAQGKFESRTLLTSLLDARRDPARTRFALIVSLEGVRTADEVRRVLEESRDTEMLLDMTVVDEAHYLRNSSTEGFKTGELLRDVSRHMILLSATPIQTSSENFFNLLSLLAPEEFSYRETFEAQLMENKPLVQLANALEGNQGEEIVRPLVDAARANDVFADDVDLRRLSDELREILSDSQRRIVMIDRIKGKYFYSGLVTRSRKRDVFPGRTHRNVASVNFKLNDYERRFYGEVSAYLREEDGQGSRRNSFSTFRLIARQRQMASCIPAALRAWRGLGVDDDFDEELELTSGRDNARHANMPSFDNYDLLKLEQNDSKFATVLAKLKEILADNPSEKIIVFSFFRNTVRYLSERLQDEGISVTYIMGGLPLEEKTERIRRFAETNINVLVSSEVGSEGIDLQFSKYELNYDLPWNPMRLEQRIGRIDRIGQESDEIFICNAYCENTIEDRILQRLYQRIEVFRNVIGDLEEVMGEQIRNLEVNVFRACGELTEREINQKAEQVVTALCYQQEIAKNLEFEAGNMASPYQEFLLKNIDSSYKSKRLLTPEELLFFCQDVLQEKFHGSSVVAIRGTTAADVRLADSARRELTRYMAEHPTATGTQLNFAVDGLRCNFGKKVVCGDSPVAISEIIDVNHPLVRWLLSVIEREAIYTSGCDVIAMAHSKLPDDVPLEPGYYAYAVQRWRSAGVRNVNELRYYLSSGRDDLAAKILSGDVAERILVSVVIGGMHYDANLLPAKEYNACGMALQELSQRMEDDFCSFSDDQTSRNDDLVKEQMKYVDRTASIKAGRIQAVIEKMKSAVESGMLSEKELKQHESLIKANEKRRDNVLARRDYRMSRIHENLDCSPISEDVAIGILCVTED